VSSRHRSLLEDPKEVSRDVALEGADRLALALAFTSSTLDVGDRPRIVLAPCDHDLVQDVVELAVTAAVAPMTDGLARRGRDRRGSGQAREGRFAAEAV